MLKQKGFAPIIIILALVILGVVGVGGFWLYQKQNNPPFQSKEKCESKTKQQCAFDGGHLGEEAVTGYYPADHFPGTLLTRPTPKPTESSPSATTSNWKTFGYVYSLFFFKYPDNWTLEEKGERGDGIWINFFPNGVTPDHTTNSHFGNETLRFILYNTAKFISLKTAQSKSITIAGQPALMNGNSYDIFLKTFPNGNDYILHLEFINKASEPYINSMLSSISFNIPKPGSGGF